MALCTLQEAKDWIGGFTPGDTSMDGKLAIIMNGVEDIIKDYCEAEFTPQTTNGEILDGVRSDIIVTKNSPIISVSQIVCGVFPDGTGGTVLASDEYYVRDDAIVLRTQVTPQGRGTMKVSYTWGYASVPAAVKQAALIAIEAVYRRNTRGTIGIASRSKEGESENYVQAWNMESGLPKEAMAMLVPYRSLEFPPVNTAERNV